MIMKLFLKFFLWLCYKVIFTSTMSIEVPMAYKLNISESIDISLRTAIADLQRVKLLIRFDKPEIDAENPYINWFFHHSNVPVQVVHYNINEFGKFNKNRDSSIIVTEVEQLNITIRMHIQRAGTFFYILTDEEVSHDVLRDIFHNLWHRRRVYKSYILLENHVFIFDPFAYDDDNSDYGKIVEYTGERSLERTLFTNMRGYPLQVQIFRSVYSKPVYDEETHKISHVIGVDWEAAMLLQQKINFTMILQEPDPNYFG